MSEKLTAEDRKELERLLAALQRHIPEFAAEVNAVLRERWRSNDERTTDTFAKRIATGLVLLAMAEKVKLQLLKDGLIEEPTWNFLRSMVHAVDRSELT